MEKIRGENREDKFMTEFRNYRECDYEALRTFLIELNKDDKFHINWNWARFEWMYAHPEFDNEATDAIGVWWDGDKIVGAAIYDMYFGEGFCGVLRGYEKFYPEVLDYAYDKLKDDSGIGIAICDDNEEEIRVAKQKGFEVDEQDETIMHISLENELFYEMPSGIKLENFNPVKEAYRFQWILWQGFDHGTDKAEFENSEEVVPQIRPNLNEELSIVAIDENGDSVAYCSLWYDEATDYAYVEPVCTIPSYRGRGVAKAVVYEALNRASKLGAKDAYVISDQEFYDRIGFEKVLHYSFYWK